MRAITYAGLILGLLIMGLCAALATATILGVGYFLRDTVECPKGVDCRNDSFSEIE